MVQSFLAVTLSSSQTVAAVTATVFTATALLGLYLRKKLSKRSWIASEYIWLTVGCLGLVGAVQRAENVSIQRKMEIQRGIVQSAREQAFGLARHYEASYSEDAKNRLNMNESAVPEWEFAAEWFNGAASSLLDLESRDGWRRYLEGGSAYTAVQSRKYGILVCGMFIKTNASSLAMRIASLDAELGKLDTLRRATTSDWYDMLARAAPVLLAFALAVRMSKTTASLSWSSGKSTSVNHGERG